MTSPSIGLELVNEAKTIINERYYSRYPEIISESYIQHTPGSLDDIHGPDGLEAYQRELLAGFPDYEISSIDIIAEDRLVMEEWRLTGTHKGEYMGIPPTDNEIDFQAMAKYVIEDEKIAEEYGYFDPQQFLAQVED